MRTAKRKRIARRELKRDPFVDRVFDWALWSRENLRTVAVVAGALLLVVLAVVLYRASQASQSRQAADRYEEVLGTYYSGNYQLAANDLRQFRNQYRGSRHTAEATIYLADSYLRAGDTPAAIETLQEFERDYEESPYGYAASNLLGAAYEASGEWSKAAEAYGRAAERARYDFQKADARMSQGRAYAAQGQREEAAEAFREVLEKYSDSGAAGEAKVRLAEVTARPLVEGKGGPAAAAVPAAAGASPAATSPSAATPSSAPTPASSPGASPSNAPARAQ